MKKTLIAVAALSAMAASAMAANVTLSGVVDFGLNYSHVKVTDKDATNSFTAKSGQNSGSRFMFKGSEELGNGFEVGFQLENGFNSDDGTLSSANRIFHRESRLYAKTPFGTLHFGRFGGLDAGTGSLSIFGGSDLAAFGTNWADTVGKTTNILVGLSSRYDNSIAYQSPTFAGFTLYLDHSFKNDSNVLSGAEKGTSTVDAGSEGRPSCNQYNAAGLKYVNGAFNAAFVYSQQNYATAGYEPDNSQAYSLGAAYDFGVCKLMAEAQYFDMGKLGTEKTSSLQKGWGGVLSVTAPVAGGTVYGQFGYKDAEKVSDSAYDYKVWNVAAGYAYSFSKRTKAYVAASYTEDKKGDETTTKTKTTEVVAGLVHTF